MRNKALDKQGILRLLRSPKNPQACLLGGCIMKTAQRLPYQSVLRQASFATKRHAGTSQAQIVSGRVTRSEVTT
jgi:hypothetical protein